MSIDPKFVELTADVVKLMLYNFGGGVRIYLMGSSSQKDRMVVR